MQALRFILAAATAVFCWLLGSFLFGAFFAIMDFGSKSMPLGFVGFTVFAMVLGYDAYKKQRSERLARYAILQASVADQREKELDAKIINQPIIVPPTGGSLN